MEAEPTGQRAGVDAVGKVSALDSVLVQSANQVDQWLFSWSRFQTTRVSPSRSISSVLVKPGQSARVPLILSAKTFGQPTIICCLFYHSVLGGWRAVASATQAAILAPCPIPH